MAVDKSNMTGLTPEDKKLLQWVLDEARKRWQNAQSRPGIPEKLHQAPEVYIVKPQGVGGIPGASTAAGCATPDCCWSDLEKVSIGGVGAVASGVVNGRSSFISQDPFYAWDYILYWNGSNWIVSRGGADLYSGPDGDCPLGSFDALGTGTETDSVCVGNYCEEDGGECQTDEVLSCVSVDGLTASAGELVNGVTSYRWQTDLSTGTGTGTSLVVGFTIAWNGYQWVLTTDGGLTWSGGTDPDCPFGLYDDSLGTGTGTSSLTDVCVSRYRGSELPGRATCDVYQMAAGTCGDALVDVGIDLVVYNVSDDSMPQDYLLAIRDKFGRWIASSAAGTPTVQTIQFRITAAGPFAGTGIAECTSVVATVLEVTCSGAGVEVGDEIYVWDPRRSWFDIPMEILIGAVGTAVRMKTDTSFECLDSDSEEATCRWVCLVLSCTEEIFGCG